MNTNKITKKQTNKLHKVCASIVVACLLITSLSMLVIANDPCWVNTDALNCRESNTTDSNILTVFYRDTPLLIIGCDGQDWYEVYDSNTGIQGFCHKDYLRLTEEPPAPQLKEIGTFKISYYTCSPAENGGSNLTATGRQLSSVVGECIAVDTRVIPYGTKVYIEGVGYRTAMDCGGAIKGNKIDVLVRGSGDIPSCGVHYSKVYMVQ